MFRIQIDIVSKVKVSFEISYENYGLICNKLKTLELYLNHLKIYGLI